ncbi:MULTISPECIES: hypothetical protein [Actinoplanes]|uniref:hypothetical protein n=1 Tax=Actinoplanes TaxID=1865 RepID=UPI0005F2C5D4|nr:MULTISPECIES: hypothetical protein [Actinoplanes]GLY06342.1 hypothetical protein Acsp01_67210 [Actinoplanes sp. NBRC 101535]
MFSPHVSNVVSSELPHTSRTLVERRPFGPTVTGPPAIRTSAPGEHREPAAGPGQPGAEAGPLTWAALITNWGRTTPGDHAVRSLRVG